MFYDDAKTISIRGSQSPARSPAETKVYEPRRSSLKGKANTGRKRSDARAYAEGKITLLGRQVAERLRLRWAHDRLQRRV